MLKRKKEEEAKQNLGVSVASPKRKQTQRARTQHFRLMKWKSTKQKGKARKS